MPNWKTVLAPGGGAPRLNAAPTRAPIAWVKPADPYACWAIATRWRGYERAQQGAKVRWPDETGPLDDVLPIRIMARAPDRRSLQAALSNPLLDIPAVYRANVVPGAKRRAMHFTAGLKPGGLDWLCSADCNLIWELATPVRPGLTVGRADTSGRSGPEREEADFRARPAPAVDDSVPREIATASIGDAIAVIDFGCPFLNARFCDARGQTRVAALWDQDSRHVGNADFADLPWQPRPAGLGYGRELSSGVIQALSSPLRAARRGINGHEATLYSRMDYLVAYDDPRRRTWLTAHGAHVLDAAGGTLDPLASVRPELGDSEDAASSAALVFVQLPALTAADASGGSLAAHVLDGVRYVLDRCDPKKKLVLNISYGTFAGPHDGSSMIERALDELLLLRQRNFAIVVAAGNARRSECHLRRTVRKNRSALLRVNLVADDVTDTFVEIWYPPPAEAPGQAGSAQLRARVRTAGRDWSGWAHAGTAEQLIDPATRLPLAVLQHELAVPQSLQDAEPRPQKALILLALAATAATVDDDGPLNDAGVWEIEVALLPSAGAADEVTLDAWVERDDPGEFGAGAAPCFMGLDRDDQHHTLSSLATGKHTIVVGGYRLDDGLPASYSSLPDIKTPGTPNMIYAPCEESAENASLPGAAVASNDVARMSGTSVAAPVVARRLFNALMAKPGGVGRAGWQPLLDRLSRDPRSLLRRP